MHKDMIFDLTQGQGQGTLEFEKSTIFKVYLSTFPPPFAKESRKLRQILVLRHKLCSFLTQVFEIRHTWLFSGNQF